MTPTNSRKKVTAERFQPDPIVCHWCQFNLRDACQRCNLYDQFEMDTRPSVIDHVLPEYRQFKEMKPIERQLLIYISTRRRELDTAQM